MERKKVHSNVMTTGAIVWADSTGAHMQNGSGIASLTLGDEYGAGANTTIKIALSSAVSDGLPHASAVEVTGSSPFGTGVWWAGCTKLDDSTYVVAMYSSDPNNPGPLPLPPLGQSPAICFTVVPGGTQSQ